jgi:ADP-ribosyl-[dinitrogen reductase] hydrolase
VVHTLEAAVWAFAGTASFEEAVLRAVNLGDDADTVGAVAGQIAGAVYGLGGVPERWTGRLHGQGTSSTSARGCSRAAAPGA